MNPFDNKQISSNYNSNYSANPGSFSGYPSWQPQFNTNVMLVTSLDEALMKTNMRNSDMLYLHQDKPIIYRVKVDMEGRKSWAEFVYSVPNPDVNIPATRADFQELSERLSALEAKYSKEVTENAQSDG